MRGATCGDCGIYIGKSTDDFARKKLQHSGNIVKIRRNSGLWLENGKLVKMGLTRTAVPAIIHHVVARNDSGDP